MAKKKPKNGPKAKGPGGYRKGAGRKVKYPHLGPTVQFSASIPEKVAEAVDEYCAEHDCTKSDAAVEAFAKLTKLDLKAGAED